MKTCSKCMAENADDAKFCKLCSSPLQQGGGKTCPSGRHTMDPTWTECAYCKADAASGPARAGGAPPPPLPPRPFAPPLVGGAPRKETVVEGGASASPSLRAPLRPATYKPATYKEDTPLPPRVPPQPFSGAPPNTPPAVPTGAGRSKTSFGSSVPAAPPSVSKARRIVGVLVTYSWRPEGKIYEVREGRNLIGRDPSCEICVPEDETLSGLNSHITFRNNFVIGDMVSMMGTDVNGHPVEEQFYSLPNYSSIRSGSTHFTFLAIAGVPEPSGVE